MKREDENRGDELGKLSPEQKEILTMLTKDFETPKRIALRRKTSLTAVYKIIKKLRKKGFLTRGFVRGLNSFDRTNPSKGLFPMEKLIRLHGQQFKIKIIESSNYYKNLLKTKNQIFIDANPVNLYKNSIIVSCNELRDFREKTPDLCLTLASNYWNKIFFQLQDKLKIIIIKAQNTQINQFNGHFSELNNELAKYCNEKKANIRIKGEGDNLTWLIADKSWNINELETIHPREAQVDMQEAVQPFFNSLRKNKGYTPQLILDVMGDLIKDRAFYAREHRSHVASIRTLGKQVNVLGKEVGMVAKGVKVLNNRLSQKNLKEWI